MDPYNRDSCALSDSLPADCTHLVHVLLEEGVGPDLPRGFGGLGVAVRERPVFADNPEQNKIKKRRKKLTSRHVFGSKHGTDTHNRQHQQSRFPLSED